MNYSRIFLLFIFLLFGLVGYSQDSAYLIELRGRIDVLGNTTIEILPTNQKRYISSDVIEINSVIGQSKGKAIDVLNNLSLQGFTLISSLFICSDNSNNYIGNFLIYYLKKKERNEKK